jgi:hypothetical protein
MGDTRLRVPYLVCLTLRSGFEGEVVGAVCGIDTLDLHGAQLPPVVRGVRPLRGAVRGREVPREGDALVEDEGDVVLAVPGGRYDLAFDSESLQERPALGELA